MKFCPKCGSHARRLPNRKGQPKFCSRCGVILTSEEAPREPGLKGYFPYKSSGRFRRRFWNKSMRR